MDDINGMMKYSSVNRYGKYYSRKKRSKMMSTLKPLGNLITNDGMNQQDAGKENSVNELDNVKQPSPMAMFNASSKPIWSGIFKINSEACLEVDAHLSSKALKKVEECSRSLQPVLEVVKLPRLQVWPKGWESSGPTDACIGLYFFPSNSRSKELSDELVNEVTETDSALKVTASIADLLIFPSVVLPEQNQLYDGKHYLWGLFRRRKDISDEVVLGGEQNASTCAVPVDDYRGQQEEHLLKQVAEAQPACPEQITCAMNNDSHVENPPVESSCEAQIDKEIDESSMDDSITGPCLTTLPGNSLSADTEQPNSPKAASNCSLHLPEEEEEVRQPGDTITSSPTKLNASTSVAAQLAEKTAHGESSSSGSEPLTRLRLWHGTPHSFNEGTLVVSEPAEMVTIDSNNPAVGTGLNPGMDGQHRSEEGEPPEPNVEPSQACLELFPITEEQMGLAPPGAGTSKVDLELRLGMPMVSHL